MFQSLLWYPIFYIISFFVTLFIYIYIVSVFLLALFKALNIYFIFLFSKKKVKKNISLNTKNFVEAIAIETNQNLISNSMFSVPKGIFFRPSWAISNSTDVMYFRGLVVICGFVNCTSINLVNIDTVYPLACFFLYSFFIHKNIAMRSDSKMHHTQNKWVKKETFKKKKNGNIRFLMGKFVRNKYQRNRFGF